MVKRAPPRRRPRKAKPGSTGLTPGECRLEKPAGGTVEVSEAIEKAGGCVVGAYKEPLGGHPVLLSILPIDAVEPTPFQRDLSDAHHKRLADVINKTGRFLDPIIAVLAPRGGFWTPPIGGTLRKRQEQLSEEVKEIAWKAHASMRVGVGMPTPLP